MQYLVHHLWLFWVAEVAILALIALKGWALLKRSHLRSWLSIGSRSCLSQACRFRLQ
jgi:hypothetical protein